MGKKDNFDKKAWKRQFFNEWYHGSETYEQYHARIKKTIRKKRCHRLLRSLGLRKE